MTATASSGLAVSYTSLTLPVCTVSGNSVTLLNTGTCTIRASQAGNANYAAAPNLDRSLLVYGSWTITYTYDGAGNIIGIQRSVAP